MRNLFDVTGKVVLVTGGSRGIGEMIARGYVENGATVYISSRKGDVCDAIAAQLSSTGRCLSIPADLGETAGIADVAAHIAAQEGKLDVLVNNAGANWAAPIEEYSEFGWDKVHGLNLRSVFFLIQAMLPLLRVAATPTSAARVINVASVDGLRPPPYQTYAYTSSKAGLMMLTRHLAAHLAADHILVNAIAPGPFESQMMAATLRDHGAEVSASIPLRRIGTPEDMAGVALFLGSRASAYVTGAIVPCDGGYAEC